MKLRGTLPLLTGLLILACGKPGSSLDDASYMGSVTVTNGGFRTCSETYVLGNFSASDRAEGRNHLENSVRGVGVYSGTKKCAREGVEGTCTTTFEEPGKTTKLVMYIPGYKDQCAALNGTWMSF